MKSCWPGKWQRGTAPQESLVPPANPDAPPKPMALHATLADPTVKAFLADWRPSVGLCQEYLQTSCFLRQSWHRSEQSTGARCPCSESWLAAQPTENHRITAMLQTGMPIVKFALVHADFRPCALQILHRQRGSTRPTSASTPILTARIRGRSHNQVDDKPHLQNGRSCRTPFHTRRAQASAMHFTPRNWSLEAVCQSG